MTPAQLVTILSTVLTWLWLIPYTFAAMFLGAILEAWPELTPGRRRFSLVILGFVAAVTALAWGVFR